MNLITDKIGDVFKATLGSLQSAFATTGSSSFIHLHADPRPLHYVPELSKELKTCARKLNAQDAETLNNAADALNKAPLEHDDLVDLYEAFPLILKHHPNRDYEGFKNNMSELKSTVEEFLKNEQKTAYIEEETHISVSMARMKI